MINVIRYRHNPILRPDPAHPWESRAVFNGNICHDRTGFRLAYRAESGPTRIAESEMYLSTIGCADSPDGLTFTDRRPLVVPTEPWEQFGCEDPRVTFIDPDYYLFYTAVGAHPPDADHIRVALAITRNCQTIDRKYLITPFNAKAMCLFPTPIQGRLAALLTVHTDRPPATIGLRYFDHPEELWDTAKWQDWYADLPRHAIELARSQTDHTEIGAPPVLTDAGWLLIYSYINHYFSPPAQFTIEAVLLDRDDPSVVIGRTRAPLLIPQAEYEVHGLVPNIVFPSGAIIRGQDLAIYYGGADTVCAMAVTPVKELINQMTTRVRPVVFHRKSNDIRLARYPHNPILAPRPDCDWEQQGVFNTAALSAGGRIHLLYRAFSADHTSVLGYASLRHGDTVTERPAQPAYTPREPFEKKSRPDVWSGCEDPRLTAIGDYIYMCYTAYDGVNPTRVALTSIPAADFLAQRWNWNRPQPITPRDISDKNACLFPAQIRGRYALFHRIDPCIWLDYADTLNFSVREPLRGSCCFQPRPESWDSLKIGIGAPPILTDAGWLLIYHGVSAEDRRYRLGVMLLKADEPSWILARPEEPILEPATDYEKDIVFTCGAVVLGAELMVYYGGADFCIGLASISLPALLHSLKSRRYRLPE